MVDEYIPVMNIPATRKIKRKGFQKGKQKMNKEAIKSYNKSYWKANKGKINAQRKANYNTNPEKAKAQCKAWRLANSAKERIRKKAWRKANPQKEQIQHRAWCKANRDKRRDASHKYRALKYQTEVEVIKEKEIYLRDGWVCQHCKKRVDKRFKYPNPMCASLDHIIPLSQGGTHTYKNVQLAHLGCNAGKKDRVLPQGEQMRMF